MLLSLHAEPCRISIWSYLVVEYSFEFEIANKWLAYKVLEIWKKQCGTLWLYKISRICRCSWPWFCKLQSQSHFIWRILRQIQFYRDIITIVRVKISTRNTIMCFLLKAMWLKKKTDKLVPRPCARVLFILTTNQRKKLRPRFLFSFYPSKDMTRSVVATLNSSMSSDTWHVFDRRPIQLRIKLDRTTSNNPGNIGLQQDCSFQRRFRCFNPKL